MLTRLFFNQTIKPTLILTNVQFRRALGSKTIRFNDSFVTLKSSVLRSYNSKATNQPGSSLFWEDSSSCSPSWIESFQREDIPHKSFQISFSRSGGPGGQNVNKVSTKVEMRFCLSTASWLPLYIRQKLRQNSNRVNKNGDYLITSNRNRTQLANVEDCVDKIYEDICKAASTIPKPTDPLKQKRIEILKKKTTELNKTRKVFHSNKKASRRNTRDE